MMRFLCFCSSLLFLISCNNSDSGTEPGTGSAPSPAAGIKAPENITFNIMGMMHHDTTAYTQGLEIYQGKLYESTGDFVNSSLRITDLKTGQVLKQHKMGSETVFGEGITIFKELIYQLTWKNNIVNVYSVNDITKPVKTFKWPYEGWGITHDSTDLIISDGSANIYFVDPLTFRVKTARQVVDNYGPIAMVNELEYIDGHIYANVFGKDVILKIDPSNGHVVGKIQLPGIIQQYAPGFVPDDNEVLNGIAWDKDSKRLFVTGKRWPKTFELSLN